MLVHNNRSILRLFGAALLLALATFSAAAHQAESTQPVAINSPAVTATGTVAELTVKNQLTGVTLRYFGLKVDQGGSYALTGTGLDTLSDGSRINATGTLTGNVFNVALFSSVASAAGLARVSPKARTRKTVEGALAVYHKDFFEQGRGEFGLSVRHASGEVTLLNVAAIPDSLGIDMLITADGTVAADGSSLDTSTITILALAPAKLNNVAAAPATNNVLVVPIKFTDSPGDPFTVAQINSEFQTRVGPYYQEVSYGQQLLNITVANSSGGWLNAGVATPANCDWQTVGNLADAAATAAGYNINSYQNRYYVMTRNGACGWAGLAYVGFGRAWSNGYNALRVYGHELGHNFGLWHSGSLTCSGQVIGGSCSVAEYGDPFDAMGNIYPGHFNSMQKSLLGWFPAGSVKTHTSGSATYTLSPLETLGQSTYAVKIPAASNRTYWIEYRQPIGVDSGIASSNGAQFRVATPLQFPCTSCGGNDTQILDMTLGTPGNFADAALPVGQIYTDSTYGISVNVLSATASALTLSVSAPSGGTATTTSLASAVNPSTVAAGVTFTASVTGTAPTGSVNFTDGGSTISGCGAVALAGAGNVRTAACSTSSLAAGSHSIVANYGGDSANAASNSAPLSQVVNKATTTTTLSSSPNPSPAVGTPVTFTATVTPVSGGSTPTGTITFKDGTTTIGSGSLNAGGIATLLTSALTAGTHSITAVYGSDATFQPSTSTALNQVVSGNLTCNGNSATNAIFVEHYYTTILRRPSDAPGKASWMSEADRLCTLGADPKETFLLMANAFFNTAEYLAFNRDNNGFVTDLYNAFFSRLPDPAGFSYWVGQLASGMPRNNVMSSFLFSAEFTATMNAAFPGQTARAETYLVLNLYGGLFRRLADSGGYTYWTGQFRTAQCNASPASAVQATIDSVSSQFVASAEYAARASSNSQYVVDMYYALLQRGAETAGYNYWVGQLNGGILTREQVRQQFLSSPEMQAQSAAIAAQGCLP